LTAASIDPADDTDDTTLKAGLVSATLLDIRTFGQEIAEK
jgi:hypothetical protein